MYSFHTDLINNADRHKKLYQLKEVNNGTEVSYNVIKQDKHSRVTESYLHRSIYSYHYFQAEIKVNVHVGCF
jgi:hypothetical protein